jgi:hypothetical protein
MAPRRLMPAAGLLYDVAVTELPTWAIWLAVFLVPVLPVVGGLFGNRLGRKTAQREELMRQMRWAADHAISKDPRQAQLGTDQLIAILASDLLTEDTEILIDTALQSLIAGPKAEIEEAEKAGEEITVVPLSIEEAEAQQAIEAVGDVVVDSDEQAGADGEAEGDDKEGGIG